MTNNIKKLSFYEIALALLPLIILLRTFSLNLFFLCCSLLVLFNLKKILKKLVNYKWIIFLSFFFIYLILNSLFATDQIGSLKSSLPQVKFLFFSLFIFFFIKNFQNLKLIFLVQSFIILFVSTDILYQYLNDGVNIIGINNSNFDPNRYSGLFGHELISATFLLYLSLPIITYFLKDFKTENKFLKCYILLFTTSVLLAILISGERMNTIIFILLFLIINFMNLKIKISLLINMGIILLIILSYLNINTFQNRVNNFYDQIKRYKNNEHIRLFSSAINIWSNHKLTGVGNKNYKIICDQNIEDKYLNKNMLCSSHPHNLYFELLSETGLVGITIYFLFIISFMINIFTNTYKINAEQKPIFVSIILIFLTFLFPIRSSGSIFSTFYGTFFWYNLGLILLFLKFNNNNYDRTVKKK